MSTNTSNGDGDPSQSQSSTEEVDPAAPLLADAFDNARNGRFEDAIAKFEQALAVSGLRVDILRELANGYTRVDRLTDAASSYEALIRLEPGKAKRVRNVPVTFLSPFDFPLLRLINLRSLALLCFGRSTVRCRAYPTTGRLPVLRFAFFRSFVAREGVVLFSRKAFCPERQT
jgi:hypothetical protein